MTLQEEILKTLNTMFRPEDRVGVWANLGTTNKSFNGSIEDAAAFAAKYDDKAVGIYIRCNPVSAELATTKAAHATDVPHRRNFVLDFDPVRDPKDTSSTDIEKNAAGVVAVAVRKYLESKGFPEPIKADSGNGFHYIYRVDMPNDAESTNLLQKFIQALKSKFDTPAAVKIDEKMFDAGRLTKLYETMTRKGDGLGDRPHRRSGLLSNKFSGTVAPVALFQAVIDDTNAPVALSAPQNAPLAHSKNSLIVTEYGTPMTPETFEDRVTAAWGDALTLSEAKPWVNGTKWILEDGCPFSENHSDSGAKTYSCEAALILLSHGAIDFKCQHNHCQHLTWHDFKTRLTTQTKIAFGGAVVNAAALKTAADYLIIVDDTESHLLTKAGEKNVIGIPESNDRTWLKLTDKLLKTDGFTIYLSQVEANDTSRDRAEALARLIGIDRVRLITLPEDSTLESFFTKSTLEDFNHLRADAKGIELKGVLDNRDSFTDVVSETFKYQLPWPALQGKTGLNDGNVLDILAPAKCGKTSLALELLEYMTYRYNESSLCICFEMTTKELASKTHILQVRVDGSSSSEDADEQAGLKDDLTYMNSAAKTLANNAYSGATLKYDSFSPKSFDQVITRIRDAHRLYGVKFVVIDNLQLLNDSVNGSGDNMAQSFSVLSKMLINIAKELNVKLVRILQPKRLADGQTATRNSVYGTSQTMADCDSMLILHRSEMSSSKASDAEEEWDAQSESADSSSSMRVPMRVQIAFTRHGSGGQSFLLFDGAAGLAITPIKSVPANVATVIEDEPTKEIA